MTLVLAVHLPLALTMPVAIVIGIGLVRYWLHLSRAEVPASRRRIRRVSVVFMLVSLPMFVRGLSVLDSKLQPREYLMTWTMAMLMVGLVMITAMIDALNNMRIHRRMHRQALDETAEELSREINARRQCTPASQSRTNGEPRS